MLNTCFRTSFLQLAQYNYEGRLVKFVKKTARGLYEGLEWRYIVGIPSTPRCTFQLPPAIPVFNVYNTETVMGAVWAAEEARSPVILQTDSRLFESGVADFLAPSVLAAAHTSSVPVCYHLDHGTGETAVIKSVRLGCTGVMCDGSSLPLGGEHHGNGPIRYVMQGGGRSRGR